MDPVQHARHLFATGRMHDALEAAQAACDRAPKDSEAWSLLARTSRNTGRPAASDGAFRRASRLDGRLVLHHRVSGERFLALVEEARGALPEAARRRLDTMAVRAQPVPTAVQVRSGVDPDALT